MTRFWPLRESAQADYESLRDQVLGKTGDAHLLAVTRFERLGLAGLIARPSAAPILVAKLVAASRPPWSPHVDPRLDALADGYALLLADWSAAHPFTLQEANP